MTRTWRSTTRSVSRMIWGAGEGGDSGALPRVRSRPSSEVRDGAWGATCCPGKQRHLGQSAKDSTHDSQAGHLTARSPIMSTSASTIAIGPKKRPITKQGCPAPLVLPIREAIATEGTQNPRKTIQSSKVNSRGLATLRFERKLNTERRCNRSQHIRRADPAEPLVPKLRVAADVYGPVGFVGVGQIHLLILSSSLHAFLAASVSG